MAKETLLTVLFSDLVGSTKLSSQFDPEDWRDIVRAYQRVSVAVLQRLGGHIAQYQGDGLLVYFGYPQAYAEDAQHAVQAGLGIVTAVAELNERLQQEYSVTLAVRIGVHTGPAIFGALGEASHPEQLAVGETPTIAAGIQDLAAPNSVVVSTATAGSLSDAYTTDDRGTHPIKGVAAPVQVLQVRPLHQDLQHQESSPTNDSTEQRLDEAERRHLTVMFCQLAGATQLAAQLSPEAVLNIVQDYQTASAEVITRYEGHIAQYLDTGLLVYFGYPTAHEEDAQRAVRATGAGYGLPMYLVGLAEACGKVGQAEDGLSAVAEGLATVNRTEERWYEAELYRLKGELTLQFSIQRLESGAQKEAEGCFQKSLAVARRQKAKVFELRTVMSLSRLWQQQGKKEEARQMLAEIYGWFTEGFDTKDLQDAKALLEELT